MCVSVSVSVSGGIRSPTEFIPEAERTGTNPEIVKWNAKVGKILYIDLFYREKLTNAGMTNAGMWSKGTSFYE
jgi:EAL domain-containing protein (putative c-di-GMP-specific phosphodiesterase class I)